MPISLDPKGVLQPISFVNYRESPMHNVEVFALLDEPSCGCG
jgi:hypothetical protein